MWMDIEDVCGCHQASVFSSEVSCWFQLPTMWSECGCSPCGVWGSGLANQWVAFSWPKWLAQTRTCDISWSNQSESQYCCGRKGWVFFACRISPEKRWTWHCCSHGACEAQGGQGLPHGDDSPEKLGLRDGEEPIPESVFWTWFQQLLKEILDWIQLPLEPLKSLFT